MTRLESFRNRVSLQTLIVVLAVVIAPAFGVAIAAALRGQILFLVIVGGLVGIFVTLYAPIELLLLVGVLGALLADSRFDTDLIYYGRFVPMGMLTIRTLLDLVLQRGKFSRRSLSFFVPGIAFAALALFSSYYSLTPEITFQRSLSMIFVIASLGLGLPNYLDTFPKMERALKFVVALIGLFILAGVAFGTEDALGIYQDQSFLRINGFFKNPNTQGLMAMIIFFPLVWWRQVQARGWLKQLLTPLMLGWAILVIASGSRASFLGMVGGAAILLVLYGKTAGRYAVGLGIGLALALILAVFVPEFGRALDFGTPSVNPATVGVLPQVDRPFLIQRAIELGMRSPIYGVGFSASDKVFLDDVPYLQSIGVYIAGSHNSYTRMFVDLGIVGLASAFWVFIIILGRVFIAPPHVRRDTTIVFLSAAVVAGLVNAFFEDWLFGFGNSSTLPMWFFLALIPIRLSQLTEESAESEMMNAPVTVEATT